MNDDSLPKPAQPTPASSDSAQSGQTGQAPPTSQGSQAGQGGQVGQAGQVPPATQPPKNLSALSSMSSGNLPQSSSPQSLSSQPSPSQPQPSSPQSPGQPSSTQPSSFAQSPPIHSPTTTQPPGLSRPPQPLQPPQPPSSSPSPPTSPPMATPPNGASLSSSSPGLTTPTPPTAPVPPTSSTAPTQPASQSSQFSPPQSQAQPPSQPPNQLPTKPPPQSPTQSSTQPPTQSPIKQPPDPKQPAKPTPQFAKPKQSILRFAPFLAGGLVVVGVVGFVLSRFLGGSSPQPVAETPTQEEEAGVGRQVVPGEEVVLQYWGLWEPEEVMSDILADFERQNPGVRVDYVQQSSRDYRERLQTAIAAGQGPDVFRFHASWTPMLRAELAPIPSSVISGSEFGETFYPVASQQLQSGGQVVGVPLMYEGLALIYNTEIFQTANLDPPSTWAELQTVARQLTIRTSGGGIERAGAALGNTSNVEHFSDILALLMLQNNADFANPNSPEARDALRFYTNFATGSNPVWGSDLPMSSVAFAREDVAMIFAPSWRILEILTMNPDVPIGVAPVPQLSDERIAWASYWAEGVSARSQHQELAAELVGFLAEPEVLRQFYDAASQVRYFGEIYPRQDMADELADDPLVGAYLQDAPYAQSWYLNSYTHDNGLNDQIIKYYEDAVNAIVGGSRPDDVLTTLDQGTQQVLRQYVAD